MLTLLTIFLLCFFHLSVLSYSYFMSRFIPIMIIRTILATCFSILQPILAHEVRLLISAIFNPNLHGRTAPVGKKNPRPPARKFRSTRAENLHRSAQLSAGVRAEQPRNSSEKVNATLLHKRKLMYVNNTEHTYTTLHSWMIRMYTFCQTIT